MHRLNPVHLIVLAIPLTLAGCVEYDQEVVINKDGSGTVRIHYNSAAQEPVEDGAWLQSWAENVPDLPFSEEEIIDSYGDAPLVVEDVSVATIERNPDASYRISFDNIEDLNGRGIFYLEEGKLTQTFSLEKEEETCTYEQNINFDWPLKEADKSDLAEYVFVYNVNVPGEILETNGTLVSGDEVNWEYSLAELLNAETTLWVTYNAPKAVPSLASIRKMGKAAASWIIGILILCAFIAVPALLVILKRDKFLFMPAVIKALEKGPAYKAAVGVVLLLIGINVLASGVLGYLLFWAAAVNMAGIWRYACFGYAIIFGVIIYMITHVTFLRAKNVLELPASEYIVTPIVSTLSRLAGEVVACKSLAIAIFCGGVVILFGVAAETKPSFLGDNAGVYALVAALALIFGFASMVVSYLVAELLSAVVDIAKNVKSLKEPEGGA